MAGRRQNRKQAHDSKATRLPSREDLLRYISDNPDRTGKREIARAFGLKGSDRIWLKDTLREMQDEGLLTKTKRRLSRPGALPRILVLDIFSREANGGLLARPAELDDAEDAVPLVAIRQQRNGRGPAAGIGDRVLARISPTGGDDQPAYTGRVIKIFEKRPRAMLGVLRELADGTLRIEATERRQPELIVEEAFRGGAKHGDLVEVEMLSQGRYGLPRAKVREVIGSIASEKAVSLIAIHAHEIPHIFPESVLKEAEEAKPAPMKGREDWRKIPFITIDPYDAKDYDDAVFAQPDSDENNPDGVVVTVAIADVAYYVRPGSALDQEALRRGNSVYFPDRVVPMLPERISNDLGSLRENEARPAMAVRMRFSRNGRKIGHTFHRVMMRSAARLSYEQVQAAIDGHPDEKTRPLLETVLRPLWDAYAILNSGRRAREPLELELPERKILLKADGTVDRVIVPPRLEAHRLIEEFMIQANVAAAEALQSAQQPLVYRVHDAPSLAKQETLREFLASLGISLARGASLRPSQFNSILAQVAGTDHEQLVNEVVLRSQSQAIYTTENIGHFGLNLRHYTHFTSPIRRYADLIVHRALITAFGFGDDGLRPEDEEQLEEISALVSATERRAMAAERETVDRLVAEHLASRVHEEFSARISGVTSAGLFVLLPEYGADGFVPISSLNDDYYIYDEARHALVGRRSGRGYQLGDAVDVRLVEVAPLAGALRFEMISDPLRLPGSTKSLHKARRSSRVSKSQAKMPKKGGRR